MMGKKVTECEEAILAGEEREAQILKNLESKAEDDCNQINTFTSNLKENLSKFFMHKVAELGSNAF